jgi:hypothetical protein
MNIPSGASAQYVKKHNPYPPWLVSVYHHHTLWVGLTVPDRLQTSTNKAKFATMRGLITDST